MLFRLSDQGQFHRPRRGRGFKPHDVNSGRRVRRLPDRRVQPLALSPTGQNRNLPPLDVADRQLDRSFRRQIINQCI